MRNTHRPVPIPHSTIVDMEQRLELPEPSKYHWERRSAILHNDGQEEKEFLREGWSAFAVCIAISMQLGLQIQSMQCRRAVNGLILEALANPEPPFPQEDISIKVNINIMNYNEITYRFAYLVKKFNL